MKNVIVGDDTTTKVEIGQGAPIALISGPCVIEGEDIVMEIAEKIKEVTTRLGVPWIFKSSFEKDNRGSATGFSGIGIDEGLRILQKVKDAFEVPVTSDVHRIEQVDACAEVLDLMQVPAYLCQQTSFLLAIGEKKKPTNVKKGQFLAPENMASAVGKLRHVGCDQVVLTERGSCFGYNRLVSDLRCIPIMKDLGVPVVYDPTHIVRIYGVPSDDPRGGEPQFVPALTRAAVAAGCNALFIETHTNLAAAKCDAVSMLPFEKLERLLTQVMALQSLVREWGED
ncbi:MAG: 3-deoxy-8-phosphooctulonate synthase [Deltaproteobacteria bacterium]|nr:3-deoxy-8-phosphooctulonate synthase [Deltaproteobacteria bacterium]MCB9487534.1 3-deoxy-8-phosphooctulonate synthase [Deltaproteobacteria bacterium]